MNPHDLRHAYAILELSPPVTEACLKSQHKALAKRWHPDRFQADPIGQAEATERLRNINIAYELVAASLEPASVVSDEPSKVVPQAAVTDRPFSLSREQIDAIVDSINRDRKVFVLPRMSFHRWLSLAAVLAYVVSAIILFQVDSLRRREINKVAELFAYFWLPLYLIWTGDNDSRSGVERLFFRISGWLFMGLPASVMIAFWIAG